MDFSFNDDHLALREAVQRFCAGEYPAEQRGNAATPAQSQRRRDAMAELGLLGLPFSADVGGSEQGAVEVMLVSQELGNALGDWAFVASTVMAGQVLTRLGSVAQQKQWLPCLASGQKQMAVAVYEAGARYDWQRTETWPRLRAQAGCWMATRRWCCRATAPKCFWLWRAPQVAWPIALACRCLP